MRKSTIIERLFIVLFFSINTIYANPFSHHRLNLSITLSGHILIGVGYDYCFDINNKIRTTIWLAPEKGIPYAYSGGYAYSFNNNQWQPELGLEYMVISSPPLKNGRKTISLLTLTPALNYLINNNTDILSGRIWISYLLKNGKIAPTGLEFRYNKAL